MDHLITTTLSWAFGYQPNEIGPLQIGALIVLVLANLYILAALVLKMHINKIAKSKALSKII